TMSRSRCTALAIVIAAAAINGCGSGGDSEHVSSGGSPMYDMVKLLRVGVPGCLPDELPVGAPGAADEGRAHCTMMEGKASGCDCARPGRSVPTSAVLDAARPYLAQAHLCDATNDPSCANYCACTIAQLNGTATDAASPLYACQNELTPSAAETGFCLID